MPRSLNTNVFVNGNWYGPGHIPPAEVAQLITNPDVWDGELETVAEPESVQELQEPPRHGKGSSLDAWRGYAEGLGVELEDGMTRDDVIAAVDLSKE